jgi:hypothetical protein
MVARDEKATGGAPRHRHSFAFLDCQLDRQVDGCNLAVGRNGLQVGWNVRCSKKPVASRVMTGEQPQ